MSHATAQPSNPIVDALRLPDRELADLLSKLAAERNGSDSGGAPRRKTSGRILDLPRMLMHICQPSGHCVTFLVKPCDIHEHGIVFLHGCYVQKGSACAALLRTSDGQPAQIPATVFRCRHIAGRVHELVAVFNRPIRLENYAFADGAALNAAIKDAGPIGAAKESVAETPCV